MNLHKRKQVKGRWRKFPFSLEPRGSVIIWHPLDVVPDEDKKLTLVRNVCPEPTLKAHPYWLYHSHLLLWILFVSGNILKAYHNEWFTAKCWLYYLYSSKWRNKLESQVWSPGVPKPLTHILPILLCLSRDKKLANNSLRTDTGISKKDKKQLLFFFLNKLSVSQIRC